MAEVIEMEVVPGPEPTSTEPLGEGLEYSPAGDEAGAGDAFPQGPFSIEACRRWVQRGSRILERTLGPHWQLDDEDTDDLAQLISETLNDLFPEAAGPANPWVSRAALAAAILGPRIMIDVRQARDRRQTPWHNVDPAPQPAAPPPDPQPAADPAERQFPDGW